MIFLKFRFLGKQSIWELASITLFHSKNVYFPILIIWYFSCYSLIYNTPVMRVTGPLKCNGTVSYDSLHLHRVILEAPVSVVPPSTQEYLWQRQPVPKTRRDRNMCHRSFYYYILIVYTMCSHWRCDAYIITNI